MITRLNGSYGLFSLQSMNPCNASWKACGVKISLLRLSHVAICEKVPSISSWLWPEDKKERVTSFTLQRATWHAAQCSNALFLSSLLALSPCKIRWVPVKLYPSWFARVKPWEMISMLLLLVQLTKCGLKTVMATWPWIKRVVELKRGRAQLLNSFENIVGDFGQLCFAASMESMMAVTVAGSELDADNLLTLRFCQYTLLSAYCRARCFCSCATCALRAWTQCANLRMIRRCLMHWLHFEWWFDLRILNKCPKSCCQTWCTQHYFGVNTLLFLKKWFMMIYENQSQKKQMLIGWKRKSIQGK